MRQHMKKTIIMLAVIAMAALSCSKQENGGEITPLVNEQEEVTYLKINSVTAVEHGAKGGEPSKSAIKGTSFPTDEKISIGLFVVGEGYTDSKYSNIECVKPAGSDKFTDPQIELIEGKTATVYAYYPYDENIERTPDAIKSIPVASSICGDDWMWGTPIEGVSAAKRSIDLKLNHALALVEITFNIFGSAGSMTNVTVAGGNGAFSKEGTMDATSEGAITPDAEKQATKTSPFSQDVNLQVSEGKIIADCLLVPGKTGTDADVRQDFYIKCTYNGKKLSASLTGDNGVIVRKNTKSTIVLNIKDSDSKMEVVSVGVDGWNDKVSGNSAELDGHTVTFNCPEGFKYDLEIKHEATAFFDEETESAMRSSVIFRYEKKELTGSRFFFLSEPSGCKIAHDEQNGIITITDLTQDVTVDAGYGTYIPYTATARVEPTDKNAFGFPYDDKRSTFSAGSGIVAIDGEFEVIGEGAFKSSTSLTGVDLSGCEGLKTIKKNAFDACTLLTSVKLPEGLETIESNAFWHMGAASDAQPQKITFPSTLKSIWAWAFEQARISGIEGFGEDFESFGQGTFKSALMSSVDLSGCSALTAIPESCFEQCDNLASVDMSGCTSLKTIGKVGFAGCDALASAVLPQGLEAIGERAFKDCTFLSEMTLKSASAPSLANDAFSGIELSAVFVNKSATGHSTLLGYKKADIWKNIPNGVIRETGTTVTLIPYTATARITLKTGSDYSLGANTEYVSDESASRYDTNTSEGEWFVIGQGSAMPTQIPAEMFYDNDNLQSITIPEGVETIGAKAFNKCTNLSKVSFPTTLATIEENPSYGAFEDCSQLKVIDLGGCTNLKDIPLQCFNGCNRVTSLTLPDNLGSIGDKAFLNLGTAIDGGLYSITLPASLTKIGANAFGNSKVKNVILYSNLKVTEYSTNADMAFDNSTVEDLTFQEGASPGTRMFTNCSKLITLHSYCATPPNLYPNNVYVFDGSNNIGTVYVPYAYLSAYRMAWSELAGKIL